MPPPLAPVQSRLKEDMSMRRLLRSPAGAVLTRPWLDAVALYALARWFFPLSRLWAAARAAEGSADRFFAEVPMAPVPNAVPRLQGVLKRFEAARLAASAAERAWREAFFGTSPPPMHDLVAIEAERHDLSDVFNRMRWHFRFLTGRRRAVPPVRWDIPSPEEAFVTHGAALGAPAELFTPPAPMPALHESHRVAGPAGVEYWLRFRSPSAFTGDEAFARVYEPEDVDDPPTVVLGHGICIEPDHWHGIPDEARDLCRAGIRVVRPEAPWHGRRLPPGGYGGEAFVARGPIGLLEGFAAQVAEWAVLIDWARRGGRGPVAVGGVSLGALTAQILITRARSWPVRLRPDAAYLVTHCGHMADVAAGGSLTRAWGGGETMRLRGWEPETAARWFALLDPEGRPAVPPEAIVTVLGTRDSVTPFEGGRALIDSWNVPEENRFVWRRGHFTVAMALSRDSRPLRRFCRVLVRSE